MSKAMAFLAQQRSILERAGRQVWMHVIFAA
jgi:hypothetical protein